MNLEKAVRPQMTQINADENKGKNIAGLDLRTSASSADNHWIII